MNGLSTVEFLLRLRSLNVTLSAAGDRLRCRAPRGAMTPDLQKELVARKTEILEFLKEARLTTGPQPPRMKRIARDGELPLSFAQMRLWLLDRLEPCTPTYNIPSCHRLKGKLNLAAFEQSLTEVVRRHETLRTCFLILDGRVVQKIVSPKPFQVSVVDLQGLPEAVREEEAARLALVDARQPFNLGETPLMRATLLKLAAEEQVLLLNMHHIAFDGWSWGVFARELSELYKAFLQGQASPLAELPIQYADFAMWQREWLQGEALETQLDYWKEKLRGNLPYLRLPTDFPRPALQTYNGSTVSSLLSPGLTERLKAFSRREGVTLFVTLLAAFQVLLLRYTGQEDLLVGTPIANRNREEIEGLIGVFLNVLVMRSDLSGNPSFWELLRQVRETALGAYAHQDLPFEKLVEELNPERDLSRSPFFQVLMSLQNTPMQPLEFSGLKVSRMKVGSATSKFDLSLYATEMPEGLSCTFEYNTDLFEADRIERMLGHLQVLLEGVVAHPEQRLSNLPMLTGPEKHRLLVEFNQTQADVPRGKCIHDLLEEQAERTPESVALAGPCLTQASASQVSLTYAELNQRANELAYYLRSLGVGPGVLVAVCIERTVEMVVGLLAVLKAGGAYVPLDPAYPSERLAFILEDTQVPVVLTQQSIAASLPCKQARVVCLDDPNLAVEIQKLTGDDFRFSHHPEDPSHLAYVLYTSGSTGKPKGVEICHRAVVNFLNSMREVPGMDAQDTLLSVTTLSFDIFGLELWLPLTTGAKVVIAPEEVVMDGRELAALMRQSGATVMQATPFTWRLLLESGWEGNRHLKILCGGEAWPEQLAEQLLPKCASLWNMYGPTETTIWSAVHAVEKGKPVLIGPPIANTQFYVVDRHLQPVPLGVPGELLIGGQGLARGYLKRPELTAEKFIANPFSTDFESRLYRTGDLVRYLADGTLEFLGRIDQQVKIRGFRIELEEIENVMRTHSGVAAAVVIVREDGGNQRLVAYFVPSTEPNGRPADLRDYLKAKLPSYMVPTTYVRLEKLPLTPNGKIDRKALPPPDPLTIERPPDSDVPRDMLEQQLTQLWRRILDVPHIGLGDDFFDLGGHSLAAAHMFFEIERLTGKKLPLATLFQASTVGELAEILRKDGWSPPWSSLVPINPGGSQLPLFLVHGAEGNVLLYRRLAHHLGPDQPVYGLQSQGLNGNGSFHTSIEEMASHYVRELIALQPSGPYRLGGYCLGGTIAFEMAQQLQAQGERVSLVAMLDTYNPNTLPLVKLRTMMPLLLLQNVWFHSANFCLAGNKDRWSFVREKWDVALARLEIRLRAVYHALHVRGSPGVRNSYPHLMVKRVNDEAASRYVPRPYSGRVVVIQPKANFSGLDDPSLGWNEVVHEGLEVRRIRVYPKGMLVEPFVQMLAQELSAYLREAK
jgi:aspartate racemase